MLYIFLLITFSLLYGYFFRKDTDSLDEIRIKGMDGFVVTSIIAALVTKGILSLEAEHDLLNGTLGDLELYLLNHELITKTDWYQLCFNQFDQSLMFNHYDDLDIG